MAFTKITPADTTGKGVIGLPDTPELSSTDMQEKFDELALDVIVPKFNNLVDEITDAFVEEGGDISDVAQALTDEVARAQGAEGDLSDAITTLDGAVMKKATYDSDNDGVVDNSELLNGHADSYFATAQSVSDLTTTVNGKMTRSTYDADNDGVVDNAEALGGHGASYFATASALSDEISRAQTAEGGKVDKVNGKGLSTNDYTDADKAIVSGVTSALSGKVDKEEGKGLSSNDFTTSYKNQIGTNTSNIGNLSSLVTTAKDNLVVAINEAASAGGASDIDDLTDVTISNPADGQVLKYNSASSKWENGAGGGGGASTLSDLTDTAIATPSAGQILQYSSVNKWTNVTLPSIEDKMNVDGSNSAQNVLLSNNLLVGDVYKNINFNNCAISKPAGSNQLVTFSRTNNMGSLWEERINGLVGSTDSVYIVLNSENVFLNIVALVDSQTFTAYLVNDITDAINESAATVTFYIRNTSNTCGIAHGNGCISSGDYAFSSGLGNVAKGNGSSAEGGYNLASGGAAHVEGYQSISSNVASHAEGQYTTASGMYSHAEGNATKAAGVGSHAEGAGTKANGDNSHAEGSSNTAGYANQHVQGKYNDNKSTTLFEIGNGTSANRKNIFEIYDDGYMSFDNGVNKIKFGVDANGRYGYIKAGADTVYPFKNEISVSNITPTRNSSNTAISFTYTDRPAYFAIVAINTIYACWSFISFEWAEIADTWTNKKAVWHVRTTSSSTKSLRDDYSSYISVSEDTNNKTITVASSSTSYKFNATDYIVQAVAST